MSLAGNNDDEESFVENAQPILSQDSLRASQVESLFLSQDVKLEKQSSIATFNSLICVEDGSQEDDGKPFNLSQDQLSCPEINVSNGSSNTTRKLPKSTSNVSIDVPSTKDEAPNEKALKKSTENSEKVTAINPEHPPPSSKEKCEKSNTDVSKRCGEEKDPTSDLDEEEDETSDSQQFIGSEEEQILLLDRTGLLQNVVGPDSILSQELLASPNKNVFSRNKTTSIKRQMTQSTFKAEMLLKRTDSVCSVTPSKTDGDNNCVAESLQSDSRSKSGFGRSRSDGGRADLRCVPSRQTSVRSINYEESRKDNMDEGSQEVLTRMDRDGELDNVFGSQSRLTQEIYEKETDARAADLESSTPHLTKGSSLHLRSTNQILSQHTIENVSSSCSPSILLGDSKVCGAHSNERKHTTSASTDQIQQKDSVMKNACGLIIDAAQAIEKQERKERLSRLPVSSKSSKRDASSQTLLCDENINDAVTPKPKRRRKRAPPPTSILSTAEKAASLSRAILDDPAKSKQLLLRMALVRENPRTPRTDPPSGTVITHGFFWGSYPSLENILRTHMKEYYDLSTNKRQSRDQQMFNNKLVALVREKAKSMGWEFNKEFGNERKVRDRIRCFFKTHIQNSKKRLRTMLKNPTKRANAKALVNHMDLMDEKSLESDDFTVHIIKNKPTKSSSSHDGNSEEENIKKEDQCKEDFNCEEKKEEEVGDVSQEGMSNIQVDSEDMDAHDAAQQVLALGFARLSQDTQVGA